MNIDLHSPPEAHYTVYRLTSPENKIYIGFTGSRVKRRWQNGKGYSTKSPIGQAISKYGWKNFKKDILCEKLTREGAEKLESWFVNYYNSMDPELGYNCISGGTRQGCYFNRP